MVYRGHRITKRERDDDKTDLSSSLLLNIVSGNIKSIYHLQDSDLQNYDVQILVTSAEPLTYLTEIFSTF